MHKLLNLRILILFYLSFKSVSAQPLNELNKLEPEENYNFKVKNPKIVKVGEKKVVDIYLDSSSSIVFKHLINIDEYQIIDSIKDSDLLNNNTINNTQIELGSYEFQGDENLLNHNKPNIEVLFNHIENKVYIDFNESSHNTASLKILSHDGKIYYTDYLHNKSSSTIDLSNNDKGYYFIEIICGEEKIIKKIYLKRPETL